MSQFPSQRHSTKHSPLAVDLQSIVTQAFTSLMETMLSMRREMETQRGMVNQIIAERGQMVDLVQRLSDQVVALTQLQDSDHAAVEVLLASRQNGMGPRDVN